MKNMILYKSKEKIDTRGEPYPLAFRWILEIDRWYIHYSLQYKRRDNKWYYNPIRFIAIHINKWFSIGFDHVYYDGHHCSFSLGWLHFNYSGLKDWCDTCYDSK